MPEGKNTGGDSSIESLVSPGVVSVKTVRRAHGLSDICLSCGKSIRTMAFKGTDFCSELCRKNGKTMKKEQ